MRLALISDIHGNNVALEAVLTAISTRAITQVICLGDVASTGPEVGLGSLPSLMGSNVPVARA